MKSTTHVLESIAMEKIYIKEGYLYIILLNSLVVSLNSVDALANAYQKGVHWVAL